MDKVFVPKQAGMTKKQIVRYINEEMEMYDVEIPFLLAEVTNAAAQKFVDALHRATEAAVDMREEDAVEERTAEVLKWLKSIKRTDIVKAIVAERGY